MDALRLTILGLGLGLVPCDPTSAQDLVTPADRVNTHVNVRAAADVNAAEIDNLEVGEAFPLVESHPLWYEVQLPDGQTGFVSKAWTTVSPGLLPRQQNEIRIHFLNIGAGTCTVVECPGPNAPPLIIDCGSTGATAVDMDEAETRTYIRDILVQYDEAPNVVLSHADLDHYRYIAAVLDDVPVASVWQGGDPDEYESGGFPEWLIEQGNGGAVLHQRFDPDFHNDGQPLEDDLSCGDASTFVLTVNTGTTKNSQSLVLMIEYDDFRAVFTGDAEGSTEAQAIENYPEVLTATVMTASHHGASTHSSNSPAWAELTVPDLLISSAGNKFFHPRCAATDRFVTLAPTKKHDVRCGTSSAYEDARTDRAHYVTEVSGTIIITSTGRSPMAVNCTRSVECGVSIAH